MEFEYEEVAKIAAEAMDNYLMFDKLLQCESNRTYTAKILYLDVPLFVSKNYINFAYCSAIAILPCQSEKIQHNIHIINTTHYYCDG